MRLFFKGKTFLIYVCLVSACIIVGIHFFLLKRNPISSVDAAPSIQREGNQHIKEFLEKNRDAKGVHFKAKNRKEAESLGLLNVKKYKTGSYTFKYFFFPGHVNYVDETTGDVVEVDPTFEKQADNTFVMSRASYTAKAPEYADEAMFFMVDGESTTFTASNITIGTTTTAVLHIAGVQDNNTIIYADAFGPGIDYVLQAEPDELRKLVVFKAVPADISQDIRIEFKTSLKNKTTLRGRNTRVENIFFRQPAVWDSSGIIEPIDIELDKEIFTKIIPKSFFERREDQPQLVYPVTTDVTTSYYAGAGDGYVGYTASSQTWDTAHDETGDNNVTADYTGTTGNAGSEASSGGAKMRRAFFPIDTSGIADNDEITAARLKIWATAKNNGDNDANDYLVVVQTTQAATTSLVGEDYDQCGSVNNPTAGSATLDIGSVTTSAYNTLTLNSTAEGWISKTGTTQLGIREGHDAVDDPITGSATNDVTFSTSENTGTTQDPVLEVDTTAAVITSVTTQRTIFATSTANVIVSASLTGETNASSTLEYVLFFDRDGDNTPDTDETYVTGDCAGSALWSANQYTFVKSNFTIANGESPKTHSWECANTNFPENGLYTIYLKWKDAIGTIATLGTTDFQSCDQPTGTSNWYDTTFENRVIVNFRSATFSEALLEFPALVKATTTNFGFDDPDSSSNDVIFIDGLDDGQTVLNFEREFYDATTTREGYWWVRVPKIATSTDCDYVQMYYDKANASDTSSSTATWRQDYYEAVWHFNETGTTSLATLDIDTVNDFNTTTLNTTGISTVQGWVDGSNSNEGFYIGPWDGDETDGGALDSSEGATAARLPKFTVTCSGPTTYKFRNGEAAYTGTTDTYMDQTNPTFNYGSSTSIAIDESTGATTDDTHGLIKFDLSSIPTNCTVTAATINFYVTNAEVSAGLDFDIVEMKQSWVEGYKAGAAPDAAGGATWNAYDGTTSWNTAGAEGKNTDVVADFYLDSTLNNHDEINATLASRKENGQSKFGYSPKMAGAAGNGIGIPDSAGFDVTSYTLTGWFRRDGTGDPATFSKSQTIEPFIAKGMGEADTQAADIQFSVGYNRSGQATLGANWEDDRHASGNDWSHLGGTTISNSVWKHFGVRLKDKAILNLYLDGFKNNTTTYPINQGASTGGTMKFGIGTAYNTAATADGGWNGYLDEIRVYKVALATTTASDESAWLRAEWYTADNGYVEWGTEATTSSSLSIVASSTVEFPSVTYSFSKQSTTAQNIGGVQVTGVGSWTLNLSCNDGAGECLWRGQSEKDRFQLSVGLVPAGTTASATGVLCDYTFQRTCTSTSGDSCATITLTGGISCFPPSKADITLATGSSADGTFWLKEADWELGIPAAVTASLYTTTIVYDLQ